MRYLDPAPPGSKTKISLSWSWIPGGLFCVVWILPPRVWPLPSGQARGGFFAFYGNKQAPRGLARWCQAPGGFFALSGNKTPWSIPGRSFSCFKGVSPPRNDRICGRASGGFLRYMESRSQPLKRVQRPPVKVGATCGLRIAATRPSRPLVDGRSPFNWQVLKAFQTWLRCGVARDCVPCSDRSTDGLRFIVHSSDHDRDGSRGGGIHCLSCQMQLHSTAR